MSRGTAVILANTVFEIDNRVRKEAESLAAAGFEVVCVGFVRDSNDLESQSVETGRIIRVRTPWGPVRPAAESAVAGNGKHAEDESVNIPRRRSRAFWTMRGLVLKSATVGDLRLYRRRLTENRLLFERAVSLEPRLVIACDLLTLPAGVSLKRATGTYLIYDSHELAVEQYADWSPLRRWLFRRLEGRLIRSADLVTTVGPVLASELGALHGVPQPMVVMNGPSEFTPQPEAVHDPVRILFQGKFARNRGLITLVQGMDRLRDKAVLTLQGYGDVERELRDEVRRLGLEGVVVFDGAFDPETVVERGRSHDIGVISYPLSTKHLAVTTPNKVMDYLGAGLAIASVDAPGITCVVDVDRCGVTFDSSDPAKVLEALEALVDSPQTVTAMKRASAAAGASLLWADQWRQVQHAIDEALPEGGDSCSST